MQKAYLPVYGGMVGPVVKQTIANSFPGVSVIESNFWRPLLVDDEHKFVYVPISKNACTSIKNWYAKLKGDEEYTHEKSADFHNGQGAKYNKLFFDDYFVFAVVRNPIERLLSAYVWKFLTKKDPPVPQINRHINGSENDTISFGQFVRFVANSPDQYCDVHWRPQHTFLEGIKIDYLARMETLTDDLKNISKEIGIKIELDRLNKSKKYDLNGYYTPMLRQMAEKRYAKDGKEFGYE